MTRASALVRKAGAALSKPTKRAIVKRELELIGQKHGCVTPEVVVGAASSPKHPLHNFFEWDDRIAGEKYRLDQARQLIMTVRVLSGFNTKTTVRAFVPLYDRTKRFFPREEVLLDDQERSVQLERALAELRAWHRRWSDLGELESVRKALRPFL